MADSLQDLPAKILIAEDDAIVALDLQGMVTRLGYDVVAIVDTVDAVLAAVNRFRPDIILLDLGLNGAAAGIEAARQIKELHDVPVIFCVSNTDLTILVRTKDVSYAGYLIKPINPDSLSTTLDTALYKYNLERRIRTAEQNYRRLAEVCEVLTFFHDRGGALKWSMEKEQKPAADTTAGEGTFDSAIMLDRLEHLIKGLPEPVSDRLALSMNLPDGTLSAVIAVRLRDESWTGLIIPLNAGGI